jgi:predicted Zn-dependent protease with MMP-like domain
MQTMDWNQICALAATEIENTLERLPLALRERAAALPVTFEKHPSPELQADGIEPDILGLFAGPEFAEEAMVPMPPQIILFLENIREMVENDKTAFREEVSTTFLHELGHYLGLDEDDLMDRGLE